MAIPNDILSNIKTANFKKFPDIRKLSSPMDKGLWALWLLQDHFKMDEAHFTAEEISNVLLKRKILCSKEKITRGFTRSDDKVDKEKIDGVLSYMILQTGIDHLQKLLTVNGNNDEYFSKFVGGSIHTFFLLQIDLANHTKWFREKQVEKNTAKKNLAMLFEDELCNKYGFYRLFWAGDGGIFVKSSEASKNFDVVIDAADTIYQLFKKWKTQNKKLDTKTLNIRVSAHNCQIFADEDPGFWTSEELNNFIKYERDISQNGFSITEKIRDKLTSSKQARFNSTREISNKDGNTVMKIFQDSLHKL